MIGAGPPLQVFQPEQLAMFTYICERSGTPSFFFFTYNVPQEVSAFQHDVLHVCVSRVDVRKHFLPNACNRFPRPLWHICIFKFTIFAHFCQAMEAVPLNITDLYLRTQLFYRLHIGAAPALPCSDLLCPTLLQ